MSVMCSRPSTPPKSMKAPKSVMFFTTPLRVWPTWSSFMRTSRFVLRSASSSTRRETTMLRRRLLSLMILNSKLCPRSSSMLGTRRTAARPQHRRAPGAELRVQDHQAQQAASQHRRLASQHRRRVLLEAERKTKRDVLMKELQVGQTRKGVVKNITDFGAFIDLGGVDGLLHITDMSYGRVQHPSEMVRIGQELEVKVLDIDWERERISLGLKQLQAYPWKNVAAKYPVGTRVQGKVVSITNYGAFVELEPGIEGLVHISEMSWTRNVRHPSKIVSIGETIEAVGLKVDETEEKGSLGMKQTEEDPWMALPQKYPGGTRLKGKGRNLTSFGAVVENEPGIDGVIHISG